MYTPDEGIELLREAVGLKLQVSKTGFRTLSRNIDEDYSVLVTTGIYRAPDEFPVNIALYDAKGMRVDKYLDVTNPEEGVIAVLKLIQHARELKRQH